MKERSIISSKSATGTNYEKVSANARADRELKRRLQHAVNSITVPPGLEARVLKFIKANSDFAKNGDERSGN